MSITVEYLPQENIVHAQCTGVLDMSAFKDLILEVVRQGKPVDCHFVVTDFSKSEMKVSIADLYTVPNLIASKMKEEGGNVHIIKRAIVVSKEQIREWQFYEDTSHNRAHQTQVFLDVESAIQWLKEMQKAEKLTSHIDNNK